jgi:hypothetical protein
VTAFIHNVTFDAEDPRALGEFWSAATGYTVAVSRENFVALRAPDKRGVRQVLFFRVDDPTPGKNRMHLDLASRDPDVEIERLLELGAQLVDARHDGVPVWREGNGTRWVVLQDPDGNESCIG